MSMRTSLSHVCRMALPDSLYNVVRNSYNRVRFESLWRAKKTVDASFAGVPVKFTIVDPVDYIQSIQNTGRFYEEDELAQLLPYIKKDSVFVDIGSNTGQHSIFALKVAGAKKAVLFEPIAQCCRIIRSNIAINDLGTKADLKYLGVALSDHIGVADFQTHQSNLGGSSIIPNSRGRVKLVRGDDVLSGIHVDFIKIDTEGHELAVLSGLRETINRHNRFFSSRLKKPTLQR